MTLTKWLLRKITNINTSRMSKHLTVIQKNTGKKRLYILFDMIINFITRGAGYTDYFRGDYINLTKKEKNTFVTTKKFYKIIDYLNNPDYTIILKDKLIFNHYFSKYLKRDYIDLHEASLEQFKMFLDRKDTVFVKPATGEGGHGIQKLSVKEIKDVKELYQKLKANDTYLVEEEIVQCRELNEINPHVVNSFRVITLYKDGKATVINNAMRINQTADSVIGCTNDLYFSLDEHGLINSNVIDDYGKVYHEHPLTHKVFSEVKIKGVKEAFKMCQEAALMLPQVRYIGWDIAFTDNGPLIVEGNEYPGYGLVQHYKLHNSKTGHLKEISDVLKEEMVNIKL